MTEANLLDLVPVRLAAECARIEGKVRFEFPRFRSAPGRWFGRLLRTSPTLKLSLDEISTAVWDLVDGRRTVAAIGEGLRERFAAEIEPLHQRLATLLGILEKNRLIRLREE